MSRSASIFLGVMLVASQASAEIFKCAAKNGLDLYQNFPCQFDSMGWVPTDTQGAKARPLAVGSNQSETKTVAGEVALVDKSISPQTQPQLGMTAGDVRAIWGEPIETIREEPGQGSPYEVWSYSNSRSVRFSHKGRVLAIQQ